MEDIYFLMAFPVGAVSPTYEFSIDVPHITLLPAFNLPRYRTLEFIEAVAEITALFPQFTLSKVAEVTYGDDHSKPALTVRAPELELSTLHKALAETLYAHGGKFFSETYCFERYSPHVSNVKTLEGYSFQELTLVRHEGAIGVETVALESFPLT